MDSKIYNLFPKRNNDNHNECYSNEKNYINPKITTRELNSNVNECNMLAIWIDQKNM